MAIIKTPAQLQAGSATDTSVVHSSQNDNTDVSRKHTERDISRLQSSILPYVQKTYEVGDLVKEGNITYRCIIAITIPEVFTEAKWEKIGAALGFFARCYNQTDFDDGQFASVNGNGANNPIGNFKSRCTVVPVACNLDQYTFILSLNDLTEPATISMFVGDSFGNNQVAKSSLPTIPADESIGLFQNTTDVDFIAAGQTIAWGLTTNSGNNDDIHIVSASCRISEPL